MIINKENLFVEDFEFAKVPHDEFNNLTILDSLGIQERLISLLKDIGALDDFNLKCINTTHGGYIPIKLCNNYKKINVLTAPKQQSNLEHNVNERKITNIISDYENTNGYEVIYVHNILINLEDEEKMKVLLCPTNMNFKRKDYETYVLLDSDLSIHVCSKYKESFENEFKYYLKDDNKLEYDNLLHLTMIVKDAGDKFEDILRSNMQYIDRWTILDTGSTDNTIDIIKRVLVDKKKGNLYQEPFINFRDSRNRCLDLAGTECKFIIMLDDTYILEENIRNFLISVRGDQFSDSFSLYIKSNDSEYGSNRIIKSETGLRYIYKLHEVITPTNNINVIIPMHHAYIYDYRSDYMEKRTMDRKKYDLKILYEMLEENPDDSRPLYYLGQTYSLLERYETALEFFLKRINHADEGFIQEKIDACFESARLCNFKLNRPWNECEELYKRAYEMDPTRPDSLYFLGIHYYLEQNYDVAFDYMKQAYDVGYPMHCQYSLKPTLSYYFLPKFLSELSFMFGDINLGKECCHLFLRKNKEDESSDYYIMKCWDKIYNHLYQIKDKTIQNVNSSSKPILVFLVDGGFKNWSGKDIDINGVGGSETFIIEISKYIQLSGHFNVIVFCKCDTIDTYQGVEYRPIDEYAVFSLNNKIDTCIVSRYPEYLPLTYKGNVDNVYLILHDLIPDGEVIIRDAKLKNIFCLSDWHSDVFKKMFPILDNLVKTFSYGIDMKLFDRPIQKQKYKFIYSSFPHRGLLQLLEMWPKIYSKYPESILHIHCDLDGGWVNSVRPDAMNKIKDKLKEHPEGIYYEGWTDKKKLADNWLSSDVWLYPCTFLETFCLTALEAAITNTLVITNDLGALQNTVGERGIIIKGDASSNEWQEKALEQLFYVLDEKNEDIKKTYLKKNYEWARGLSWESRANELLKIMNKRESESAYESNVIKIEDIINYYTFKTNKKNYLSIQFGKSKEIEINNIVDDIRSIKQKYDIILCFNVEGFEYSEVLVKAYSILNKNGLLIISNHSCSMDFIDKYNLNIFEQNINFYCLEMN